jgi:hypothetical protein
VTAQPEIKWKLEAWPDGPWFVTVDGKTRSLVLWRRDYTTESSARHAVGQIHLRYPDAVLELTPFKFDGLFWMGDSNAAEHFYWCPCGGNTLLGTATIQVSGDPCRAAPRQADDQIFPPAT